MGTDRTRDRRNRTRAAPTLLTLLVLLLVVLAAGSTGELTADPVLDPPAQTDVQPVPVPSVSMEAEVEPDDAEPRALPGNLLAAAIVVLLAGALALLVRYLLRFRRGLPSEHANGDSADIRDAGTAHLVVERLRTWTGETRTALDTPGETSEIVIRCWLDFEARCAEVGVGRRPTETTSDFAAAASSSLGLPPQPLAALNRLYQRARFGGSSGAPLTTADRDLAAASIEDLADALSSRALMHGANGRPR